MTARELEQAAADLCRKRRRAREAATLAAGTSVLAVLAAVFWPALVVPFACGIAAEAALGAVSLAARRNRISRLALEPAAYVLPDVERFGRRLAEPGYCVRLAAWISEILTEAYVPGNLYLADRVALFRRELDALARELAGPVRIQPSSAVACRRLLSDMVESPLYNPRLPTEDLGLALERIRAGIQPP